MISRAPRRPPRHPSFLRGIACAAWLLAAFPAAAQPSPAAAASAETEERRTRLFKEGKAAADAGQWAEAAAKFRQVVQIRSAPKAHIALGVAEEHLGHLIAAQAAYKQAREEAADSALTDDLKTANAALESIRPRIPRLTFSPSDALRGAALQLDGAAATPKDGVLPVDPGEHTLSATSPGKGTFTTTVSLKEGEQREIPIVYTSSSSSSTSGPSVPDPPDTGRSAAPPTGALMIGVPGLVLVATGAALYGAGSGQYSESQKVCPGPTCTKDVATTGNDGRGQMIVGDALMIVGAAAVAGAGIYWIVSATSRKPGKTTLFIAPRAAGLDFGGSF